MSGLNILQWIVVRLSVRMFAWIEKDLEERGRGPIVVPFRHFPGETKEYHKRVRMAGDQSEIRTEHQQSKSLTLGQSARFGVIFNRKFSFQYWDQKKTQQQRSCESSWTLQVTTPLILLLLAKGSDKSVNVARKYKALCRRPSFESLFSQQTHYNGPSDRYWRWYTQVRITNIQSLHKAERELNPLSLYAEYMNEWMNEWIYDG